MIKLVVFVCNILCILIRYLLIYKAKVRFDFWTKLGYSEYSDDAQSLHCFQSKEKSTLKVSIPNRIRCVIENKKFVKIYMNINSSYEFKKLLKFEINVVKFLYCGIDNFVFVI